MPEFVDDTVREIDERLRALNDERARLEAARSALTGGRRRPGRPAGSTARRTPERAPRRSAARARVRRSGSTRANQALELVRKQPGITIPQLAEAMKIQPNYLYRVMPGLASDGQLKREGQGWHPAA